MPLWGNNDNATGNNKPKWANTSNVLSQSTINGSVANVFYGAVYGASSAEVANTLGEGKKIAHAGWVARKEGTGGRAGRVTYETLVAMGSITGDAANADNAILPGA